MAPLWLAYDRIEYAECLICGRDFVGPDATAKCAKHRREAHPEEEDS